MNTTKTKGRYKKWIIVLMVLLFGGVAAVWYIFTEKFEDTGKVKADYTVNAADFIKEFKLNGSAANQKYSERIIIVNGTVSEIKNADTTANILMTDPNTGDYIIFAFQQQHVSEARQMKKGDPVSVKGSCSGGNYSEILGVESISFKRCAVNK